MSSLSWNDVVVEAFEAVHKIDEYEERLIRDLEEQLKHKLHEILKTDYKRIQISEQFGQAGIYEIVLTSKDFDKADDLENILKYYERFKCPFSLKQSDDDLFVYFNPDDYESLVSPSKKRRRTKNIVCEEK